MKICPRCGMKNADGAAVCANASCRLELGGSVIGVPPSRTVPPARTAPPAHPRPAEECVDSGSRRGVLDAVGEYVGGRSAVGELNWKSLFTGVFKRHSMAECEDVFIAGTSSTTPDPLTVSRTWPKPWLWSRVLAFFAATYALLWVTLVEFADLPALPCMMVVGAFAVPFSTLVLFMEINVWRNVSMAKVLTVFFIGGAASVLVCLPIFAFLPEPGGDWGATIAPFAEEPAKAVVIWLVLRHWVKTPSRLLNGMLVGAAVGAGFAAFESAGYAFHPLLRVFLAQSSVLANLARAHAAGDQIAVFTILQSVSDSFPGGDASGLMQVVLDATSSSVFVRAFFAPGGHVAYGAIHGAALSMVARGCFRFDFSAFWNRAYWRLAWIPYAVHFLWNSPWQALFDGTNIPYFALIAAIWTVILFLVNRGLAEVGRAEHSTIA